MGGWREVLKKLCSPEEIENRLLGEIQAAIDADLKNRKIPQMELLSILLRGRHMYLLSDTVLDALSDYHSHKHRGLKGHKKDREENRQTDISRALLFNELTYNLPTKDKVIGEMEHRLGKEISTIERSIEKGIQYMSEDNDKIELAFLEEKFALSEMKNKGDV